MKTKFLAIPLIFLAACSKDDSNTNVSSGITKDDTTHYPGVAEEAMHFDGRFRSFEVSAREKPEQTAFIDTSYTARISVFTLTDGIEIRIPLLTVFRDIPNPTSAQLPLSQITVKFLARPTGNSGEFKILNPRYANTSFRISAAKDSLFFSESQADGGGTFKVDHQFTGLRAK